MMSALGVLFQTKSTSTTTTTGSRGKGVSREFEKVAGRSMFPRHLPHQPHRDSRRATLVPQVWPNVHLPLSSLLSPTLRPVLCCRAGAMQHPPFLFSFFLIICIVIHFVSSKRFRVWYFLVLFSALPHLLIFTVVWLYFYWIVFLNLYRECIVFIEPYSLSVSSIALIYVRRKQRMKDETVSVVEVFSQRWQPFSTVIIANQPFCIFFLVEQLG